MLSALAPTLQRRGGARQVVSSFALSADEAPGSFSRPSRRTRELSPRLLTSILAKATSPGRVVALCREHGGAFDRVATIAALHRLAAISAGHAHALDGAEAAAGALIDSLRHEATASCAPASSMASPLTPRELASILWSLARLQRRDGPLLGSLQTQLLQHFSRARSRDRQCRRRGAFRPQEISNSAWALATLAVREREPFHALTDAACAALDSMTSQHVANVAWALGTMAVWDGPSCSFFADALAVVDKRGVCAFEPRHVANILWGLARTGLTHTRLLDIIGRKFAREPSLASWHGRDLVGIAWAYASLAQPHEALFCRLAHEARSEARLRSLGAQELQNLTWAFATVWYVDKASLPARADLETHVRALCDLPVSTQKQPRQKILVCARTREYRRAATTRVAEGDAVLELGCHEGLTTSVLASRCGADAVVGIDKSAAAVAAARRRFPGLTFEVASVPEDLVELWHRIGGSERFNKIFLDLGGDAKAEAVVEALSAIQRLAAVELVVTKSEALATLVEKTNLLGPFDLATVERTAGAGSLPKELNESRGTYLN